MYFQFWTFPRAIIFKDRSAAVNGKSEKAEQLYSQYFGTRFLGQARG